MQLITDIPELRKKLQDLTAAIFFVRIAGDKSGYSADYNPMDAAAWINQHADSIVYCCEDYVTIEDHEGLKYKLTIWRNAPQRVSMMEI